MSETVLVIGNKNYSSWSLRGWLMARQSGIAFREILIPLDQGDYKAAIRAHSAAGKVPILKHGDVTVWDSLAIGEYLAEIAPEAGLWPSDPADRAHARAVAAEMHSGFTAVRGHMPMDMRSQRPGEGDGPGVADDVARIVDIWTACLSAAPDGGDFLFGAFGIADAMYAPVISRFRTYGVILPAVCQSYADAVWTSPLMVEWTAAAAAEPWVIENLKI